MALQNQALSTATPKAKPNLFVREHGTIEARKIYYVLHLDNVIMTFSSSLAFARNEDVFETSVL